MQFRPLASSSAGNCALVSDGESQVLLDCGLPWKKIREALSFRTSQLSGILCSHAHADHSRGAKEAARAGITIYSGPETLAAIGAADYRSHALNGSVVRIGTFNVRAFPVRHDEPCLGFLLASQAEDGGKLLFLTDTPLVPAQFKGLTHIAIECNHSIAILNRRVNAGELDVELAKRIVQNHMSLERCLRFLKATDLSRVQAVWLLHLSRDNSDEAAFVEAVQRATGKPVWAAQEATKGGVNA